MTRDDLNTCVFLVGMACCILAIFFMVRSGFYSHKTYLYPTTDGKYWYERFTGDSQQEANRLCEEYRLKHKMESFSVCLPGNKED